LTKIEVAVVLVGVSVGCTVGSTVGPAVLVLVEVGKGSIPTTLSPESPQPINEIDTADKTENMAMPSPCLTIYLLVKMNNNKPRIRAYKWSALI
jgi:hypothetical protein